MAKISDMAEATVPAATMEVEVNDSGTSKRINLDNLFWGAIQTMTGDTAITASTTQTQGQMPLTATFNVVSVVANANDTVTLPAAATGRVVFILNAGANTLRVYPASGDAIGANAVNASAALTSKGGALLVASNATTWMNIGN